MAIPSDNLETFNQHLLTELDALYRTARYLTGDATLAEDIVQETSLKAIQGRHSFRAGARFRPWIFAILRNTITDHFRKQGRQPQIYSLDAEESPPIMPSSMAVDTKIFEAMLDEEIAQALADLPETMRLAVLLADIEGFRYRDIAEVLEWPMGTVMSRLYRARKKLRQRLAEYARQRGFIT